MILQHIYLHTHTHIYPFIYTMDMSNGLQIWNAQAKQILSKTPICLTQDQRLKYFKDGYVSIPNAIPQPVLKQLQDKMYEYIELSKTVSRDDKKMSSVFDLEPNHTKVGIYIFI